MLRPWWVNRQKVVSLGFEPIFQNHGHSTIKHDKTKSTLSQKLSFATQVHVFGSRGWIWIWCFHNKTDFVMLLLRGLNESCFAKSYLTVWRDYTYPAIITQPQWSSPQPSPIAYPPHYKNCADDPNICEYFIKICKPPTEVCLFSHNGIGATIRQIPWRTPWASPRASRSTRGLRDVDSSKGAAFGQTFPSTARIVLHQGRMWEQQHEVMQPPPCVP